MNRRSFLSTIIAAACVPAVKPEPVYAITEKTLKIAGVDLHFHRSLHVDDNEGMGLDYWFVCPAVIAYCRTKQMERVSDDA